MQDGDNAVTFSAHNWHCLDLRSAGRRRDANSIARAAAARGAALRRSADWHEVPEGGTSGRRASRIVRSYQAISPV